MWFKQYLQVKRSQNIKIKFTNDFHIKLTNWKAQNFWGKITKYIDYM